MLEGEMLFELEGEPERVIRAGLTLVAEDELARRRDRRAPRLI
jgi:hypothetical protein